jgi:hypothetical protein
MTRQYVCLENAYQAKATKNAQERQGDDVHIHVLQDPATDSTAHYKDVQPVPSAEQYSHSLYINSDSELHCESHQTHPIHKIQPLGYIFARSAHVGLNNYKKEIEQCDQTDYNLCLITVNTPL